MAPGLLAESAILILSALIRLWALDIKPPHFDEGINGWFVDQMRSAGFYRYDPENYHGPLYFYILFVFLSLLGRNLWALRLPAVLASIASVWMALRFDRFLGRGAAVIGALALAVSPAAIFYGRYAIHESWMVLSLMITAWGILAVWREGTKRGLIAASLGFTLMLLLKETAMIHIGCFLIAGGVLAAWQIPFPSRPAVSMASPRWRPVDLFWCAALSLLAILFFYSGTLRCLPIRRSSQRWRGKPLSRPLQQGESRSNRSSQRLLAVVSGWPQPVCPFPMLSGVPGETFRWSHGARCAGPGSSLREIHGSGQGWCAPQEVAAVRR